MHGRLKEEDWKEIVKAGKPWRDPLFPHGAHCLFINHREPALNQAEKKSSWSKFHWKRASAFYED